MREPELERFKKRLENMTELIRADLALSDPARDSIVPDSAIGRLTRIEAIQAQSMGDEGRRRQEARLRDVERALERIASGSYGTCIRCGARIPEGRLEIMPEAPYCIDCAASINASRTR